jgi:hypothetical protein
MLPQEWKGAKKSLNLILLEFVKHSWAFLFLLHYCVLIWDLSFSIFFSSFFFVFSWVFGVLQVCYCTMIFVLHMLCSCFTLLIMFLCFCFPILFLLYFFAFWCSYSFTLLWALTISRFYSCTFTCAPMHSLYFKLEQLCVSCSFKHTPLHFEL